MPPVGDRHDTVEQRVLEKISASSGGDVVQDWYPTRFCVKVRVVSGRQLLSIPLTLPASHAP